MGALINRKAGRRVINHRPRPEIKTKQQLAPNNLPTLLECCRLAEDRLHRQTVTRADDLLLLGWDQITMDGRDGRER